MRKEIHLHPVLAEEIHPHPILPPEGEGEADKDKSIEGLVEKDNSVECGVRNTRQEISDLVRALLSFVLLSGIALFSLNAVAELIDRVVASVDGRAITLSELEQAVRFNGALGGETGPAARKETLEGLINRKLLVGEAHRLKFVEVSGQDAAAEIGKLRVRLGSDKAYSEFLAKTGLTAGQLERMLGERLLVQRFIEKKIGLFIRVGRDEAEEYYAKHADRFGGRRFQEVQKEISSLLYERKLDGQLGEYIADLRSKADIRIESVELPAGVTMRGIVSEANGSTVTRKSND